MGQFWLEKEHEILDCCINEIDTFLKFLEILTGKMNENVSDITDIANAATMMLAHRSWLESVVQFSVPAEGYCADSEIFTYSTEEVLEAGAHFTEFLVLLYINAGDDIIADWRKRYLHGVYAPVFNLLEENNLAKFDELKAGTAVCKLIIDLALCAPIDIVCAKSLRGAISFADAHPGARIGRLVRAACVVISNFKSKVFGSKGNGNGLINRSRRLR